MKALFDTSVLVAAFEVRHPRHSVCLPWLHRVQEKEIDGYLSTHSFAELYSVLTRLPVIPPISPAIAQRLINENLNLFVAIPLTADDYQQAIACMVRLNLPGGGIFDALIAQAEYITHAESKPLHSTGRRFSATGASAVLSVRIKGVVNPHTPPFSGRTTWWEF